MWSYIENSEISVKKHGKKRGQRLDDMARQFIPNKKGGRSIGKFIDVVDKKEVLYLEIARAVINYPDCMISVLFYHTTMRRTVFWAKLLVVCFEAGKIVSSLDILPEDNVTVNPDIEHAVKNQIERVFGQFFFKRLDK